MFRVIITTYVKLNVDYETETGKLLKNIEKAFQNLRTEIPLSHHLANA